MRRLFLSLAVAAAALCLGASANAGALTGANLNFNLGGVDGPSLDFPADGTLTGSAISATDITIQMGSAFAGTVSTPLDAPPASALDVVIGTNTGGGWSGDPLTGTSAQINGSSIIFGFGGTPLITVPFAAGSVGTTVINEGGVGISVFAQGWTSGTLLIDDGAGGTLGTAMGTISTGTPGSVTLVAGARVATTLADDTFNILTLSMDFESVPEPTMPLLFGAGALVLGGFAWRKRQA